MAEWTTCPVALVAADRPNAHAPLINRAARTSGVRTGLRYGTALSLAPELRTDVVSDDDSAAAIAELTTRLLRFTPGVDRQKTSQAFFSSTSRD